MTESLLKTDGRIVIEPDSQVVVGASGRAFQMAVVVVSESEGDVKGRLGD